MGQETDEEILRRQMAEAIDCFTEQQMQMLGKYADTTLENLRKRGQGPDYVVFGKAFLYPRKSFQDYLQARIRERGAVGKRSLKDLL